MKLLLLVISICVSSAVAHYYFDPEIEKSSFYKAVAEAVPTRGEPWPLPQQYAAESTFFVIQPQNFAFLHGSKCDIILDAIKRYKNIAFIDGCSKNSKPINWKGIKSIADFGSVGQLLNLTISIAGDCEKYPYMNMDEQYLLKINSPDAPNKALLFSTTVWGALRGLETFSQLIYQLQPGVFAINTSIVLDFPRFSFRGLLLDTSRHYVPVSVLLQNLDAMAQTKLNVFHWHIVDDPSFPYVSRKFPDLSKKGAFDPKTHVYTQDDIANVIEYARLRGIRVLSEFDSPGHTQSWGKSQPGLLTACYNQSRPLGKYGPIDPTNAANFNFLSALLGEIANVFPDDYIHLGGDEVDFDCWKTNPAITNFMQKHGFGSDYSRLEEYYMQKVINIVESLNKSYIVWQEVFDNGVKVQPDTVIHVWKDGFETELQNVTAAGYNTILSSCWYLNYINYGSDWSPYYNCDPYNFNGTSSQKRLVIGGEACMWGEYVDGSNLISRTWPRAAAVAERLWSNQSLNNAGKAVPRLEELRCRMIKRGLKVEPVNGPGFCECDYLP